ncbi:CBS domain-containing protein [Caminibacter mediatlanticus TB-2]|uniref:CBS domain-containing protein n=1 Tax=Caminibacter mediatlanticus TB-2 TaxID=391592 RepID=A0ABX5V8X4_9BACT|nr:DUF294 nucleotidyltransferase-like domain-containing protein [Caminibacter mediatlanticus]QCT94666.1 CBS domain-containing protein [Caminibacter mediatlanticus TB-2]
MENIKSFLSFPPFDLLNDKEFKLSEDNIDIAFYEDKTKLYPDYVRIIIKGKIKGDEIYCEEDIVFAKEIIKNKEAEFEVINECLCYEIKKNIFLEIVQNNEKFKKFFLLDIATKIQNLRKRNQNQFSSFLSAKVNDLIIHEVTFVEKNNSIKDAVIKKENENTSAIIVDSNSIVTDSNLKKIILNDISIDDSIEKIATKNLITIDEEDFLFNALLLMTKHNIKRLVVKSKNKIIGIIEQIDLLSYFSNHSHLINIKIEKANNIEELKEITIDMIDLIDLLYNKGLKARYIAKIVSELNRKIFIKVSEIVFDNSYKENIALIVMGSEGRGEQIIRTDQDNGAIIDNNFKYENEKFSTFSNYLKFLGFPECPGKIMVNNPLWCDYLKNYQDRVFEWIENPTKENMMNLAIIMDANIVWGNKKYLVLLKEYLFNHLNDNVTLLNNFASFVNQFEVGITFLGLKDELDLKKARFILVHSIRSFALEKKLMETSTVERIKKLHNLGIFDKQFATDLIESFDVILSFELKNKLKQIKNKETLKNIIHTKELTKIEKDMLKDALKIINELKNIINHHFKLSVF